MNMCKKVLIILCFSALFTFSCSKEENNNNETSITDIEGNVYKIVTIGTQVWMKENLKTTKYNDGTDMPLVTEYATWRDLSTPGYCWYDNDKASYGDTYGALYNWYAVNTGKLCPTGWHIPSDEEWTTLVDYLGGRDVAGGKLKESGITNWQNPNEGATNESGFTGLPGGYRSGGSFMFLGYVGEWWTSTAYDANYSFRGTIYYNANNIAQSEIFKQTGASIRCIKNIH